MNHTSVQQEVDALLNSWQVDPLGGKVAFMEYYQWLAAQPGVRMELKSRPGVSHSLRATHENQERPLFVLVDVVDDEPEARWLSVCFYADMVRDPEERGDFVPQGLLGKDACCLNLEENDTAMRTYILERMQEAAAAATQTTKG